MNLLILYPKEFNCYSKFERKVHNIVKESNIKNVIYPKDGNGLICKYFEEYSPTTKMLETDNWVDSDITYAIIFDDGEEFSNEIVNLKEHKIIIRRLKIDITRVVNIKKELQFSNIKSTVDYEYIGRGSYWGNPHSMYEEGESKEEVIRKFKYDFDYEKFPNKDKSEVHNLSGKRLGCFCKPGICHGDVLADYLNSWDDGK